MSKIIPGKEYVIVGGDFEDNIGRVIEVVRFVTHGEYIPEVGARTAITGWLVFGEGLTAMIDGNMATLAYVPYFEFHLIPLKGDFEDEQQKEEIQDRIPMS